MSRGAWRGDIGFKKDLGKLKAGLDGEVKETVQKHGAGLQQKEMKAVPVDTGTLKRSITVAIKDSGFTATVWPTAEYAGYVEYGTRRMEAQPYIRPSFYKEVEEFSDDCKAVFKKYMK